MISFACPMCRQRLRVDNEFAGLRIDCPHCSLNVQVPAGIVSGMWAAPGSSSRKEPGPDVMDPTLEHTPTEVSETEPTKAPEPKPIHVPGFSIVEEVGRGGMGVIYKARETALDRLVALKMMTGAGADAVSRERFLREAKTLASIDHDNVITIYQVGEVEGMPFLAMPFLEGESLEQRLQRIETLPLQEVRRIGCEVCQGLDAAHEQGILHRDIKPGNIWLEGRRQRVLILDFGLARPEQENLELTQTGTVLGTPSYMSPEQANGDQLDRRSDLFSLGCVLYRLVTGQLPFEGKSSLAIMKAVTDSTPTPPHLVDGNIPEEFSNFLLTLLEKHPDDRPATAQEVIDRLEALEAS